MDQSSKGDPNGRRLARARAARLSEAGMLARALKTLLHESNFPTTAIESLAAEIAQQEHAELQRSMGSVQSRKRFKHKSGHPLREGRDGAHLYIDECGISGREPHATNAVFSLAGIAMQAEDVRPYVKRADELKFRHFGSTNLTLHEPLMRQFDGPYYFDGDRARQQAFDRDIDVLLADTPFIVFGAAVRKTDLTHFQRDQEDRYLPTDAYAIAILMLLERYVDYMCMSNTGRMGTVTFESQGPREDALHQLEFARLLIDGTQWVPQSAFQQSIEPGVRFVPKGGSHPTEIADMFSRELWEWVRSGCKSNPKRWNLFSEKMYCRESRRMGTFGVKVFPDSDIRILIEAHRDSCPGN